MYTILYCHLYIKPCKGPHEYALIVYHLKQSVVLADVDRSSDVSCTGAHVVVFIRGNSCQGKNKENEVHLFWIVSDAKSFQIILQTSRPYLVSAHVKLYLIFVLCIN